MPDYLLISTDLSGAEWHVTGYLAQEPRMIEVHKSRGDPHSTTANLMSGVPQELVKAEDKLLGKETDPAKIDQRRRAEMPELLSCGASWLPSIMTLRQAAKKSNHGFNYDMRYRRFSEENFIPEADAKKMEKLYKVISYPGLTNYYYPSIQQELMGGESCTDCGTFAYAYVEEGKLWSAASRMKPVRFSDCQVCGGTKRQAHPARTLKNCFGRAVRLLGGWGPDLYQQGYSFKPQSTVADSVLQGMCDFYEAGDNRKWLSKGQVWMTTHDDLTIQFPIEPDLTDMAATVVDISQEFLRPELHYPPHKFRLDTDVKVGFKYGDPTQDRPFDGLISCGSSANVDETRGFLAEAIDKLRSGL